MYSDAIQHDQPGYKQAKTHMWNESDWENCLVDELQQHKYQNVKAIENNFESKGRGIFKANGKDGSAVAIRAYILDDRMDPRATCKEVLRQSSLHHPHIVQPKSLIRTAHFICIALEYANGGDVYRLARRAGDSGLPVPAARFIFQQLVLALDFAHGYDIYLRDVNPSNVLVFWNDRGMPILKIADFRLVKDTLRSGAVQTAVVGTMYTCPHVIRGLGVPPQEWDKYAPVCDVWSVAVTLYFLLFGSWPFSKSQIAQWATTPREKWNDDKQVEYPKKGPDNMREVEDLFRKIFQCGRLTVPEYKAQCPSLQDILAMEWFKTDLPEGADQMKQIYTKKTEERRTSPEFSSLRKLLEEAVEQPASMDRISSHFNYATRLNNS